MPPNMKRALDDIWRILHELEADDACEVVMMIVDRFVAEIDLEGENGMSARSFMVAWLNRDFEAVKGEPT